MFPVKKTGYTGTVLCAENRPTYCANRLLRMVPGSKRSHYRKTIHILSAMDMVAPGLRKLIPFP